MLGRLAARAPAKINLLLEVGPARPDGFHDLLSVFQAVSLEEVVTVTPAATFGVEVRDPQGRPVPGIPDDPQHNLALRAALAVRAGRPELPPLHLDVVKEVPVAGGMAGGSADAAAALVACDAFWRTGMGLPGLHPFAAVLGSDVPFALHGRTAVGTGRGEHLVPVMTTARFDWVLVLGEEGLSTPAVFREFDRLALEHPPTPPRRDSERLRAVETALRAGDPVSLGAALANDLQPAAVSLQPGLARTLEAGREAGACGVLVSGSGPTVAWLADSHRHALDLAVLAAERFGPDRVRTVHGPVPGAQVLEAVRR
ncbi:4-(cytidine 5'-diphospho)-2-C-methyl-D-erythritol kinase [Kineococcus gynurae]|uniref:4-diphosphocytidyl-2-C-methyl-D-erythritol kinase n=1 Tax=Kineococcus gynurae TaxID=452979 RepID=A0ABV5LNX8_9ACTN